MAARVRVYGPIAVLAVVAAGVITTAVAPASAQPAGPTVSVDPATDLVDGTVVTVNVSGLPAHSWVEAVQCAADGAEELARCDFFDWVFTEADGSGNATLAITVDALLTPGFGDEDVDCRASECAIAVMLEGEDVVVAPLHFDRARRWRPRRPSP